MVFQIWKKDLVEKDPLFWAPGNFKGPLGSCIAAEDPAGSMDTAYRYIVIPLPHNKVKRERSFGPRQF